MKLSIIIPVYNTELYLKRCLDSVFSQDLQANDYEVIVINDGSTDDSLEILRDYEKRYNNMVLINQKNQGVSIARNEGLKIAIGESVTFIDSDDALYENVLKLVITKFQEDNLDVLYLGMNAFSEEGALLDMKFDVGENSIIKNGLNHPRRTFPPTFYKKELIGDIRFNPVIVIGEDTVFNTVVQAKAQRCSYYSLAYYKYTFRLNSASKNGASDKAFKGFMNAIIEIHHFQKNNSLSYVSGNQYFNAVYGTFVTRIIEHNVIPHWDKVKYNSLVALLNELHLKDELKSLSSKYKYIDKSFFCFKYYQKYLELKTIIYKSFISRKK